MKNRSFRYQVDSHDTIQFVCADWLDFARQNGAAELDRDAVIGRPLWEFLSGKETQHLYRIIFDLVRADGRSVTLPFRCDSPGCRRYMELTIVPLPDESLDISASLLREEHRANVSLLEPDRPRSEEFVTICSWCKKVLISEDEWADVETCIRQLELFDSPVLPEITHGLCDVCESKITGELQS